MRHTSTPHTSAAPSASPTQSGIVAVVGGDAVATGINTEATGEVTNTLREKSNGVIIARGEVDFTAEGIGSDATASANSGVNVTGADYVFEITVNRHGGTSADPTAESITRYFAIDIPGFTPPGGERVIDKVINMPSVPAHCGGSGLPSGNVALEKATVDISTSASLVSISSDTLAGPHFSHVSAWALVAA